MRMLRLLLGVMAMTPVGASAGEPTGFDGFQFGTTRSALVADPGFLARCHPDPQTETPAGVGVQPSRVTCPAYDVSDIGAMRVTLLFSGEDQLVGYVMYVGQDRENDVRTRIESVYGRPTRRWERGRSIAWLWPSGTEAIWTIYCLGTDGCLIVKATAPEKDATR